MERSRPLRVGELLGMDRASVYYPEIAGLKLVSVGLGAVFITMFCACHAAALVISGGWVLQGSIVVAFEALAEL